MSRRRPRGTPTYEHQGDEQSKTPVGRSTAGRPINTDKAGTGKQFWNRGQTEPQETTGCEALWASHPIVKLKGDSPTKGIQVNLTSAEPKPSKRIPKRGPLGR